MNPETGMSRLTIYNPKAQMTNIDILPS